MHDAWYHNPALPDRRRLRIADYDYSKNGAYFITFNTRHWVPILARVTSRKLQLTTQGDAVYRAWRDLPLTFPYVRLDALAIMPDHVHAILWMVKYNVTTTRPIVPITTAIGMWKSRAAREINLIRNTTGERVWHRSYHERIVRDGNGLSNIRRYIRNNPRRYLESRHA